MTQPTPERVLKAIQSEFGIHGSGAERCRELVAASDPEATYEVDASIWLPEVASEQFMVFHPFAARKTVEGSLATGNRHEQLQFVLECRAKSGSDPLALVTENGTRVSLVEFLCMVPTDHNLAALVKAVDTLELGAQSLQRAADHVFNAKVWRKGRSLAGVDALLSRKGGFTAAMGILAARGVQLDPTLWATDRTDILVRFLSQPFVSPLQAVGLQPERSEPLRLNAIEALAAQGFGRSVRPRDPCPVFLAAREQDVRALGILVDHEFALDRPFQRRTALAELERQERMGLVRAPGDFEACRDLLRSGMARHAAREGLAGLKLTSP